MHKSQDILEFTQIKAQLCGYAYSNQAKERLHALSPYLSEAECRRHNDDTTAARRILDACGAPPLPFMKELDQILQLCQAGGMLLPEQLLAVSTFAASCRRVKLYLKNAETLEDHITSYGYSIEELTDLQSEIEACIRNEQVDNEASSELKSTRRKMEAVQQSIRNKLESLIASQKAMLSDTYICQRAGRYVLPVKKKHRHEFAGSVVEVSSSGGTYFMEPNAVGKLQTELSALEILEDEEVRRILYMLSDMVATASPRIERNMEAMEELDFVFAKAKLSADMDAVPSRINCDGHIDIREGRHPLLDPETCVPLNFKAGGKTRGVIITGPNTGGKTVALKTVGLLSMMAQSGLHIPAALGSTLSMHSNYLCDIGDSQSITENLSTFSGHMTNIIDILAKADRESLVILDELGSGTDPAEGMGLAVAVLEELRQRGCLFFVTTHYPQVKDYAATTEAVVSARMAFDRETLSPLYRLEMGQAGESCALYIAERLGLPPHILARAQAEAQRVALISDATTPVAPKREPTKREHPQPKAGQKIKRVEPPRATSSRADQFELGDSVWVYPDKEIGIVFAAPNERGEVGVQVKGKKRYVIHKRLKPHAKAADLYPEDYDLSIVFDTVENRKARHKMTKRHDPNLLIVEEWENKS